MTVIRKGVVNIPPGGFVITANSGQAAQLVANKFKVGDRVGYRYYFKRETDKGQPINWDNVRHALGAGPLLLTNGKITVDFKIERMSDPKITTLSGSRGFVGVDKNGLLVIGTVTSVTVKELAAVVQKLGLVNAMNIDGNASSGLYFKGKYLTTPGRLLSNCLVVVKRTTPPARKASPLEQALKLYAEGKTLEANGNITGAEEKYLAAIDLYSNLTDAYLKLGYLYNKQKIYDKALINFESAINLNPKNPAPYETVAWIYYAQFRYTETIAAWERLAAADFNSRAKAYYGIGLCYSSWQMKEYDKAREYLQKAVDADPNGATGRQARDKLLTLSG